MGQKRRQSGRNTAPGHTTAAKKRKKTEKSEDPGICSDPCSSTMMVTVNCEVFAEVVPSVHADKSKTPRRGRSAAKELENIIVGDVITEKSAKIYCSKLAKRPARVTVKTRGTTSKPLTTLKDQDNHKDKDERDVLRKLQSPVKSRMRKPKSKCVESSKELAICEVAKVAAHEVEAGKVADVAVAKALPITESFGALGGDCLSLQTLGDFRVTEGVKAIDYGAVGEDVSSGVTEGEENKGSEKCIDSAVAEASAPRKSWALCDDCSKWRCIPVELADRIESTNARWSCRENPDKLFRDCSVPQEKSNSEINAELQISEVSVCEEVDDKDAVDSKSMLWRADHEGNKPAVWKHIRHNIFPHRRRKFLQIDEVMVCQCIRGDEGEVGCGDNCLNRMLSIECVAEQCPCGNACSNQQFQNSTHAPIEMYRCGKKGFGLRVTEKVAKGTFIIEYVGEVLDVSAFEERQQEYAQRGQKHFYFMTLNTNEVIDACWKGNFGRFINHSCEPNCTTEKWMVNGEVCIGLFAVRDIAKDEEVTFDYNYVRVCGAAAKKCECGSSQCRGYIGGDPLTPKAIVESDSEDAEDLEPIMLENSEDEDTNVKEDKLVPARKTQDETDFNETLETRAGGIKRKFVSLKEKAPSIVKRFKMSSSTRKSSFGNQKGLIVGIGSGRHEDPKGVYFSDVQEKLDDMLDRDGGLRKKRDAAKQYLKLLVLTSASGDSRRDASACSVRDLSLLLEALLRTTSRTVLSDIMNKNGLRMLHNLIKQLRRQWDKTPILRKLIKVLDLLASMRVLTIELIYSRPPCSGMESFSESLFELTRHKDSEVAHMVRRFRKQWMPPESQFCDQSYKGQSHEKPSQSHCILSLSPVKVQHPHQINASTSRYQSSQHVNLGPDSCNLSRTREISVCERTTPKILGASLEEGGTSNCVTRGTVKPVTVAEVSSLGQSNQAKKVRKRPSRWDDPDQVDTFDKDLSNLAASGNESHAKGIDPPLSMVQHAAPSSQFQMEGPRKSLGLWVPSHSNYQDSKRFSPLTSKRPQNMSSARKATNESEPYPIIQAPFLAPGRQGQDVGNFGIRPSTLPTPTSNAIWESSRLKYPEMSGKSQMHPGTPSTISRETRPDLPHAEVFTGIMPNYAMSVPMAPRILLRMCPPTMMPSRQSKTHGPFQQVPVANTNQFGVPPAHVGAFSGCAQIQMGSVAPPVWTIHGVSPKVPMGNAPFPVRYPFGPGLPSMLSTAPYLQQDPHVGPPFPIGPTYSKSRHSLPPAWSLRKLDEIPSRQTVCVDSRGIQRTNPLNLLADSDMDPEPPAPGLSPMPCMQASGQLIFKGPDVRACSDNQEVSCHQEGLPTSKYVQGTGRDYSCEYHGLGHYDISNGISNVYHLGARWDTPEADNFREDVFGMVICKAQTYKPQRTRDFDRFCSKMTDVIVRKEVAKFMELKHQGGEKVISKSKLVEKVESYVASQMEIYMRKSDKAKTVNLQKFA